MQPAPPAEAVAAIQIVAAVGKFIRMVVATAPLAAPNILIVPTVNFASTVLARVLPHPVVTVAMDLKPNVLAPLINIARTVAGKKTRLKIIYVPERRLALPLQRLNKTSAMVLPIVVALPEEKVESTVLIVVRLAAR